MLKASSSSRTHKHSRLVDVGDITILLKALLQTPRINHTAKCHTLVIIIVLDGLDLKQRKVCRIFTYYNEKLYHSEYCRLH